jgi:predicted CopG family antitoxin
MATKPKYKTIRVSAETYENLSKAGTVTDSFDDVIWHLLSGKYRNTGEEEDEVK